MKARYQGSIDGTNWFDCAACLGGCAAHCHHRYFVATESFGASSLSLSDVPAVAPVAADTCKAPEGYAKCPGAACQRFYFPRLGMIDGGCMDCKPGRQVADWTPTPPLAAQPAEAKQAINPSAMTDYASRPAPQPEPAKAVDMRPMCGNNDCETPYQNVAQRWCSFSDRSGPAVLEWSCEPCHLRDEVEFAELMMFESTGTPYTGPERIERPRLAHVANLHDDDLTGGAR